jgi:hypothetical protein
MNRLFKFGIVAAAACVSVSAFAASGKTATGKSGDLVWEAQSLLTGATALGTGSVAAPTGDPIYHPSYPQFSGVVGMLMDFGPGGAFICSGTLMPDRQSILTAAHCVSDGFGTANPLTTTIYFQPAAGLAPDVRIYPATVGGAPPAGVDTRTVTAYTVHPLYTGDVIDQNDIAVLRLNAPAPAQASSYGFNTTPIARNTNFDIAGYGRIGTGAAGSVAATGRLRTGVNAYDFRLGDSIFGTNWATVLGEPISQIEFSYVSDFDNGTAANDTACLTAQAGNIAGAAGAVFCNTGRGTREVGVAGGDSGGPQFIGSLVSGVNSYGLTFGTAFGDSLAGLNNSFGEFSGYVPTHIHTAFINAALVPEPGTYGMMALGMLGIAAAARRRRAS